MLASAWPRSEWNGQQQSLLKGICYGLLTMKYYEIDLYTINNSDKLGMSKNKSKKGFFFLFFLSFFQDFLLLANQMPQFNWN